MIIKSFKGEKIHRYLNFNIKFNKELNFIIGINASGKTTILELMDSLLKPNFLTLNKIFFKKISIVIETDESGNLEINAERKGDFVIVATSNLKKDKLKLFLPIKDDYMDEQSIRRNPIFIELDNLDGPVYLNANRTDKKKDREIERIFFAESRKREFRFLPRPSGDIETLARQYIMTLSMKQDDLGHELQNKIVSHSLNYFTGRAHLVKRDLKEYVDLEKQKEKRKILIEVINKLNLDKNLVEQIDNFFTEMNKIAMALKDEKDIFSPECEIKEEALELLINGGQIHRIEELLNLITEYKKNVDEIFKPLNNYLEAINLFFRDTRKKVVVSKKDRGINILLNHESSVPIARLSSGEKQILLMLSHLAFNQKIKDIGIFIIDEPELSLHLAWQEIFVESILKVNQGLQLILATHSPSIISKYKTDKLIISLDEQIQRYS